jgi:DNA-directed RNA polymerase specialized sigma24 family protein
MNSEVPVQPPVAIEDLLVHAEWLRRLATRLLGEADAEDVVQETLAVALTARPEAARARPWLAEVLRNFARRRWRRAKVDARALGALATVGEAEAPAPPAPSRAPRPPPPRPTSAGRSRSMLPSRARIASAPRRPAHAPPSRRWSR